MSLIQSSATLAAEAPIIAASFGSFGASLADGSEYTGSFGDGVDLEAFHWNKIQIIMSGPTRPNLLAFETIPSIIECRAICRALGDHNDLPPAWISFQCSKPGIVADGSSLAKNVECIINSNLPRENRVMAVGVNCVDPHIVLDCLRIIRKASRRGVLLIAYPNSGDKWDASNRRWIDRSGLSPGEFAELAVSWFKAGCTIIGGCCRVGPNYIAELKRRLAAEVAFRRISSYNADS